MFDKNNFQISPIASKLALEMVVKHHYLHRKCSAYACFGLFEKEKMLGVLIFGTPPSPSLLKGVCGPEESGNVIELSRLWVVDEAPKNSESYFIGRCLKMIDKEIVVSFADTAQRHMGVIYQATNWIYTGLSAKHKEWGVRGMESHSRAFSHKHNLESLKEMYGDRFYYKERSRKHRYIYFSTTRKRRKELFLKLRYPVLPYPKNESDQD